MRYLAFAFASLAAFILSSAVSLFWSGPAAGGRWGVFQVLCGVSVVATLLLMAGCGLGVLAFKRFPPARRAALLGAGCAAVFVGVLVVASLLSANPAESWGLLLLLPVLGGLVPLAWKSPTA